MAGVGESPCMGRCGDELLVGTLDHNLSSMASYGRKIAKQRKPHVAVPDMYCRSTLFDGKII